MRDKFWKRYQMAEESKPKGKDCFSGNRVHLSEADTFIEFCFERKCEQMKNGMEVLNEWRYHKNQYTKLTDTTIYEFQHFSRHDASHSISILETIELVVGEKRIVALSRGDLWLLLEAAYSHDLGMALTGEEMSALWGQKEFKDYILDCLNRTGFDQQMAAGYYKQMDNLLHHKPQTEGSGIEVVSFTECWPAQIANYVKLLVCDYIRKQHSERNQRIRKRIITLKDSVIPQRLYECVVKISTLHTESYNKIFEKLPREEKGIGAETVYPRFAAAMLRLGDVLDTDNNRFSTYALEHMTEIPLSSQLHIGKHKAIDSIQISTKKIKVTAVSDDLEICKVTSQWMKWIDDEVEQLICNWNRMVPHKLSGCVLRPSECKVYYNNGSNEEYQANSERHFEVNKQELIMLLIGSNIYDTRLDFIREYLQNAMDACKMQFWQEIQAGDYDEYLIYGKDKKTITPFDFPNEIYEKYRIRLRVELPLEEGDYDNACIIIEDSGIGIEKECVDIVSNLGSGWKKRARYGKYIPQMPKWLTPTGGFGIGIQSAFMVTDQVEIRTKTRDENSGRRIVLETPSAGGLVTQNDCELHHNGTIVKVKIPLNCFLKDGYISKNEGEDSFVLKCPDYYENENGIFSEELILKHVLDVIKTYIKAVIPNSIFPVSVGARGYKNEEMNCKCWREREIGETIEWNGKKYLILMFKGKRVRIWDYERQIYFEVEWVGNIRDKREQIACYKNVRSTHQVITKKQIYDGFDMFIDILGFSAKEVLKIHRNEFKEEFQCDCYVDEYMKVYLHIYDLAVHGKITADALVNAAKKDLHFQLMRIVLLGENELRTDGIQLDDVQKNLFITRTKLVIGYKNPDDIQGQKAQEDDTQVAGKISRELEKVIDPKKIVFSYKDEKVLLEVFFEEYKKMFRKENPSGIILVERDNCKPDSALTVQSILHWIEVNMELRDGILVLKNDVKDRYGIMIPLITTGYYKIEQELIAEIMKKTQISGQQFTVFSGEPQKDLKRGIAKITFAVQPESTKEGEKNFYQKSFDGINSKQAVFSADCYTERYKELYVSNIPHMVKGENMNPPYLISPITNIARMMIAKNNEDTTDTTDTTGYEFNLDTFIKLVTDNESFRFLVAWVANNAEDNSYKHNAVLVEERYKEYLREMYIKLGEKFGRDKH